MDSTAAYRISGAAVDRRRIPMGGLDVAISRVSTALPLTLLPGAEDDEWLGYTLNQVASIARRLTPWATWWCSPRRHGDADGRGRSDGTAHAIQGAAWLSTAAGSTTAVGSALHEAWHLAEDWLTLEELDAVREGVLAVPDLPAGKAWNAYYTSGVEVRANSFEAWAYSYWLRGRLPEYRRGMPADERVWTAVYRGDLGLRVARRGLVPDDRIPEALRRRMDARSDGQKWIDAARNFGAGAWKSLVLATG